MLHNQRNKYQLLSLNSITHIHTWFDIDFPSTSGPNTADGLAGCSKPTQRIRNTYTHTHSQVWRRDAVVSVGQFALLLAHHSQATTFTPATRRLFTAVRLIVCNFIGLSRNSAPSRRLHTYIHKKNVHIYTIFDEFQANYQMSLVLATGIILVCCVNRSNRH